MCVDEDNQITNPNEILKELQNFHDMLYGKKNLSTQDEDSMIFFLNDVSNKKIIFEVLNPSRKTKHQETTIILISFGETFCSIFTILACPWPIVCFSKTSIDNSFGKEG